MRHFSSIFLIMYSIAVQQIDHNNAKTAILRDIECSLQNNEEQVTDPAFSKAE